MEAEVINRIERLVKQADGKTVEIDGVTYSTNQLHDVRKKDPEPDVLTVSTLGALLKYLYENRDELDPAECIVHVVSPNQVQVVSGLWGHFQQRFTYVQAKTPNIAATSRLFSFEEYLPVESMIIALQALFTEDGDRDLVLKLLAVVTDEVKQSQTDNGVAQEVSARAGIAMKEELEVPNPVQLYPYRTFREVDQPGSDFVLRAKKGPSGVHFALFEAGGDRWQLDAIENIALFISDELDGFQLIY